MNPDFHINPLQRQLASVSVSDILKVSIPKAQGLFADVSSKTENPYQPGKFGSEDPRFLSSSTKFEKGADSDDPRVAGTVQRGMYVIPGGKHGTKNACCANGNCTGPCISETGRLPTNAGTMLARNRMFENYPVEALALLAHETHSHIEKTLRQGLYPSFRIDGTSELHIAEMDAGDLIHGGRHGEYQEIRTDGPWKGMPVAAASEYAKIHAQGKLGRPTPGSRQSNVFRVHSWNENLTDERADEIASEGSAIAVPSTGYGTSGNPRSFPEYIDVNLKKEGSRQRTTRRMKTQDFDTHDNIAFRNVHGNEEPTAGMLRGKTPSFGHKLTEKEQKQSTRFLLRHEPSGSQPGESFEVPGLSNVDPTPSGAHVNLRRQHISEQFGIKE